MFYPLSLLFKIEILNIISFITYNDLCLEVGTSEKLDPWFQWLQAFAWPIVSAGSGFRQPMMVSRLDKVHKLLVNEICKIDTQMLGNIFLTECILSD